MITNDTSSNYYHSKKTSYPFPGICVNENHYPIFFKFICQPNVPLVRLWQNNIYLAVRSVVRGTVDCINEHINKLMRVRIHWETSTKAATLSRYPCTEGFVGKSSKSLQWCFRNRQFKRSTFRIKEFIEPLKKYFFHFAKKKFSYHRNNGREFFIGAKYTRATRIAIEKRLI